MKSIITLFAILFAATFNVSAQSKGDQAASQKAWEESMKPGPVHAMMAKSDGKWKAETTMWMDPSAPPMKSTGTAENTMILGGRYQQSKFKGNMMNMPFEGVSLTGYDNDKKVFTNVWIDNMGTGVMTLEGTWDDATKTITFAGKEYMAMMKQDVPVRQTLKIVDNNTHVMTMYMTVNGQEMKTLEVKYTRM